jgi:hypothetical protein
MKKTQFLLLMLFGAFSMLLGQVATDLFISEYVEGASYDKVIEIYNGTGAAVDLSNYKIWGINNAGTWSEGEVVLTGTLANNDVYVLYNILCTTAAIISVGDFAAPNSCPLNFNGNDAVGLAKNIAGTWTLIDAFGTTSTANPADWDLAGITGCAKDHTLVRKPNVTTPTTDWTASAGTSTETTQWLIYPIGTVDYLGAHTMSTGNIPPQIAGVITSPVYPEATTPVTIQATITDPGRTISTATLSWGLTETSLTNVIAMAVTTGSVYQTATPIPVHAAGTVVYYKVTATDNSGGTTNSTVANFTVLNVPTLTIAQIQGGADASPYVGQVVRTTATVTGVGSQGFFLQDATTPYSGVYVYKPGSGQVAGNNITLTAVCEEYFNNTELKDLGTVTLNGTATIPAPVEITTVGLAEPYEGMLVQVTNATCTAYNASSGEWTLNDGTGPAVVDDLLFAYTPTLATTYQLTGPLYFTTNYRITPRNAADIVVGGGDEVPPTVNGIVTPNLTTVVVYYSETVEESSSEDITNYSIPGLTISAAVRDAALMSKVTLTVSGMTETQAYVLNIDSVEDMAGNTLDTGVFNFTCVIPQPSHLVINEIMFDSAESNDAEWVELFNAGTQTVDLTGFGLVDNAPAHVHVIIPNGHTIAPGAYFTVRFRIGDNFPFTPDFDGAGQVSWQLDNSGDAVILYDGNSTVVDSVAYGVADPWPTAPHGTGPSLELLNPSYDNTIGSNWSASAATGGTPGAQNSVFTSNTIVHFALTETTVNEGAGSYPLAVSITNPSETVATSVTVSYTSGDASDVGNFTSAVVTFPAGSSAEQTVDITITNDTVEELLESVVFTLSNVTGGSNASIGAPSEFSLHIADNDAVVPHIVINEINYNPIESGADVTEFIELYNQSNTSASLAGCYISDAVTFTFPAEASIAAYSYVVLAVNATEFSTAFGFAPDYVWTSGGLSNDGETISLMHPSGQVIDTVTYDDVEPWPTAPDGSGPTLELVDDNSDNTLATSWQASLANGGTPKALNSVSAIDATTWLTISVASNNTVLTWNAVTGAIGYNIYRSTTPYSGFTLLGTSTSATYTDTGAGSLSVKYYYYVTATR